MLIFRTSGRCLAHPQHKDALWHGDCEFCTNLKLNHKGSLATYFPVTSLKIFISSQKPEYLRNEVDLRILKSKLLKILN